MPKETGIIMSGDHPVKCLDGTKTQTRRTWGLEKINKEPDAWEFIGTDGILYRFQNKLTGISLYLKCPYGGVGDILIMRETWMPATKPTTRYVIYKADNPNYAEEHQGEHFKLAWRPSIFMPREYSRGLFEILPGLRPEKLQEITEADAIAEGCRLIARTIRPYELKPHPHYTGEERPFTHRDHFIGLWDSLNNKRGYPWDGNWWVWRIPYKKLERE